MRKEISLFMYCGFIYKVLYYLFQVGIEYVGVLWFFLLNFSIILQENYWIPVFHMKNGEVTCTMVVEAKKNP